MYKTHEISLPTNPPDPVEDVVCEICGITTEYDSDLEENICPDCWNKIEPIVFRIVKEIQADIEREVAA